MQSNIHKSKVLSFYLILLFFSNCNSKIDIENQVTIKIKSIDSKTKIPRVNTFDTIEVNKEGVGYLMKTFVEIGEYVTDSTGSVIIKVYRNEDYHLILHGPHIYGAINFFGKDLKNYQEANIEVFSLKE